MGLEYLLPLVRRMELLQHSLQLCPICHTLKTDVLVFSYQFLQSNRVKCHLHFQFCCPLSFHWNDSVVFNDIQHIYFIIIVSSHVSHCTFWFQRGSRGSLQLFLLSPAIERHESWLNSLLNWNWELLLIFYNIFSIKMLIIFAQVVLNGVMVPIVNSEKNQRVSNTYTTKNQLLGDYVSYLFVSTTNKFWFVFLHSLVPGRKLWSSRLCSKFSLFTIWSIYLCNICCDYLTVG